YSCLENTTNELDIIIKHQLVHSVHKTSLESSKQRHDYKLFGQSVCRDTFAYAHGLHRKTNDAIAQFRKIWLQQCPNILVMKPSTNLCAQCQRYTHEIANSARLTEEEKMAYLRKFNEHLQHVKTGRDYYRQQCDVTKVNFETLPEPNKI
ncbi:hypothetical protein MAR_017315, partial [Mya arenaria]